MCSGGGGGQWSKDEGADKECQWFYSRGISESLFGDDAVIQITPQMRILVAVEAVDFRKGIDGLVGLCRQSMRVDPFLGSVFVFRNKRATAIKVLMYDGQGFWLCQKRLSKGQFTWWPKRENDEKVRLAVHQLQLLLWSGNPDCAKVAPLWKEVKTP
jgi:transposase